MTPVHDTELPDTDSDRSATGLVVSIEPDGMLRLIYSDTLRELLQEGEASISRASHIEPVATDEGIAWTADLSPVGGPLLGPFPTREAALHEEVQWLTCHHL